ncbi:hypothetical protein [Gloeobacter kilaueensis]|uniref:Uncharacterized protein n=1 Tax=Gloeobacter kilaueensis (strain ATCC BAA-2537 / CCAP 1431/1 / ULC 316 / JS1) TaxID=1183438 RepID=U5QJW0_GLOK1|nr:hypothetical protein [Gloeobacter kilaueensis]AGY59178.1 hypothetical protein GKIL_2932 [Gloeobacter kilaueensis JS1]
MSDLEPIRPVYDLEGLPVARVAQQIIHIQQLIKAVMRDGEHFGKIPGCGDKPALFKAGAEKLCFTFRMAPDFEIDQTDLAGGHREYRIKCHLTAIESGLRLGAGVGCCSTLESKYRYRTAPGEPTGRPVPRAYWDLRQQDKARAQELIGGRGFGVIKNAGGDWEVAKLGEKIEHDNPADYYNTVLKIGKKRALVDAVLTVTAASDIFTQDVEELSEFLDVTASKLPGKEHKQQGASVSLIDLLKRPGASTLLVECCEKIEGYAMAKNALAQILNSSEEELSERLNQIASECEWAHFVQAAQQLLPAASLP